jgi:hypothetical protein
MWMDYRRRHFPIALAQPGQVLVAVDLPLQLLQCPRRASACASTRSC